MRLGRLIAFRRLQELGLSGFDHAGRHLGLAKDPMETYPPTFQTELGGSTPRVKTEVGPVVQAVAIGPSARRN